MNVPGRWRARQALWRALDAAVPPRLRAQLTPGRTSPVRRATWDAEYASGYWRYLEGAGEMPRYSLLVGYCVGMGAPPHVLDIGCGTGLLERRLRGPGYASYVGVDLSDVAIAQARQDAPETARFLVAPAQDYAPERHFDAIVYNEMLYYLDAPEEMLRRHAAALSPAGVFLLSLWECTQSWRTWFRCAPALEVLDEVLLRRASGPSWRVRLCRPAGRGTGGCSQPEVSAVGLTVNSKALSSPR